MSCLKPERLNMVHKFFKARTSTILSQNPRDDSAHPPPARSARRGRRNLLPLIHHAETSFCPCCASDAKHGLPETMSRDLPSSALEIRGLTKRFDRLAVDRLDLTVRAGEFYALLGPTGAATTPTFRIVPRFLRPAPGST